MKTPDSVIDEAIEAFNNNVAFKKKNIEVAIYKTFGITSLLLNGWGIASKNPEDELIVNIGGSIHAEETINVLNKLELVDITTKEKLLYLNGNYWDGSRTVIKDNLILNHNNENNI